MLDPDHRALYTDALRPPPGYRFERAVATTYSLDLQTLLTIPLHLALFSAEGTLEELVEDGVALLEALRRTTDRVTVFAQSARLLAPRQPQVLFGLLEPAVVEVTPPSGRGVFHPKVWVIRFRNRATDTERLRLLVLSRNITDDRSWDLALTLEGVPDEASAEEAERNEPLARFLEILPSLALRRVSEHRREATRTLAELVRGTTWELPDGFDEARFHPIGVQEGSGGTGGPGGSAGWSPGPSDQLAVVSPFLSERALRDLLDTSRRPLALVSRTEELATISPELLERFERVLTLAEEAEREDGEEPARSADPLNPGHGLHAKAYLAKRGWDTHVFVGSANATNPALVHGSNVEFMAELVGKRSRVGAVEDLLDADGLGAILMEYLPSDEVDADDPATVEAEAALEAARRSLAGAGLDLHVREREDGTWGMTLRAANPPALENVETCRAWLVTRQEGTAVDASGLSRAEPVELPPAAPAHLTSFVAFELTATDADDPARFVLAAEAHGLPTEARDAAIVRDILRNREGFLRYVMLLLAEAGEDGSVFGTGSASWLNGSRGRRTDDLLPLFEHMTRAYCRDPDRLDSVQRLLEEMGVDRPAPADVVPTEFLELWAVFQDALGTRAGDRKPSVRPEGSEPSQHSGGPS